MRDELYGDGPDGAYSFVGGAPDDVYDAGSAGSAGSEEDGGGGEDEASEGAGSGVPFGGGDGGDDDVNFGCDGDAACDGWGWGV